MSKYQRPAILTPSVVRINAEIVKLLKEENRKPPKATKGK